MNKTVKKYKLSELAKDINAAANEVIECLSVLGGEPKKSGAFLTPQEVGYVMEYFTQKNQVESFEAYYANNVKPEPAKEEKPAAKAEKPKKKPAAKADKAEKAEPAKAEKPKAENKPAPKAESKPAPAKEEKPAKTEPAKAEKPAQTAQPKAEPVAEKADKKNKKQEKAKKQEHGEKKTLVGKSSDSASDKGYTVSENSSQNYRTVDTRGSYVELDKYNEKYDNLAISKQGGGKKRDNFTKKQKITQKSQQHKKQQFSHKRETEAEKLRRLELERARKQQLKVMIPDEIVVSELASRLKVTATEVIKKLMGLGVMATLNETIDFDTASLVAEELGAKVEKEVIVTIEDRLITDEEDAPETLKERCPVVVVMGHVDHGKTSILDRIRNAHIADGEAGGITQHIGAYQVYHNNRKITFLDTPGHEAFTAMRSRGAQLTDIAVLIVAADDGVMPQTIEAIHHAKNAGVPIMVAINKIDKPGANPDRIKEELAKEGLLAEDWGGDVIMTPISAKKKIGLDDLLENILLVAEMQELKANPNREAYGVVVEAQLDKGRGPVMSVLVQNGTLHIGDGILAGKSWGRVRAMNNENGRKMKSAEPSVPVEILGMDSVPEAGDHFFVMDEKKARNIAEIRASRAKEEEQRSVQKVTLDNIFEKIKEGEMKELDVIIKADVQGSVEALVQSLQAIKSEEVRISIVHSAVGAINESDVMLASASNALIIGFNVRPDANARAMAEKDGVDVRLYRVIYDCIDDVKAAMAGMLSPTIREVVLGHAEIRQVIHTPKVIVAGSYVQDGKITSNCQLRLIRDGIVIHEGKIASLRRFKDDVKEVAAGFECGIAIDSYRDVKEGDQLESFELKEEAAELK